MRSHDGPPASDPDDGRRDSAWPTHPAADDVQRYANGDLDPERDASLLAHVETCAACLAEIERIRRAEASLALSSAPPSDLFARIRARRATGELVHLPVDELTPPADPALTDEVRSARDGHPALLDVHRVADGEYDADADASLVAHVLGCDACRQELEDARRITAGLSLLSHPPNELWESIAARRKSGERVILPVDAPATAAPQAKTRDLSLGARRRVAHLPRWGLAIAATLLFAIGIGPEVWKRGLAGRAGRTVARIDPGAKDDSALVSLTSATALRSAADSAKSLSLDPDARQARWRETKLSLLRLQAEFPAMTAIRSGTDSLTFSVFDSAFDGAALTSAARDRTSELAAILALRPEYRVSLLGHAGLAPGDSALGRLASRMKTLRDALLNGGVTADRITTATAPSRRSGGPDRARIDVIVLAPQQAPEIR